MREEEKEGKEMDKWDKRKGKVFRKVRFVTTSINVANWVYLRDGICRVETRMFFFLLFFFLCFFLKKISFIISMISCRSFRYIVLYATYIHTFTTLLLLLLLAITYS